MKWDLLALSGLVLAGGCSDYAGPSSAHSTYALARVGAAHLPVSLSGNGTAPFLVADTFQLTTPRARTDAPVLTRITVLQLQVNGPNSRSETEYNYHIANGMLQYDECPIGAFCIAEANLVYAPRVFQIVGDSLFEVTPVGANLPPHVYGRVSH